MLIFRNFGSLLIVIFSFFSFNPAFSVKNSALFSSYLDQLERVSGYIPPKRYLKEFYNSNDYTDLLVDADQLRESHSTFKSSKYSLIKEWERESNGPLIWPTYDGATECVMSGTCAKKRRGWKYDAHHIIPQSYGGPNEFWNLIPLDVRQHNRIHGMQIEGIVPLGRAYCCELFPDSCVGMRGDH